MAPAVRERMRQARELARSLLAEAARLGIGAGDVARALTAEIGMPGHE
jgi:hypothetical protein